MASSNSGVSLLGSPLGLDLPLVRIVEGFIKVFAGQFRFSPKVRILFLLCRLGVSMDVIGGGETRRWMEEVAFAGMVWMAGSVHRVV